MSRNQRPKGLPVDAKPISREEVIRLAFVMGRNSAAAKALDAAKPGDTFLRSRATSMIFVIPGSGSGAGS